MSSTLVCLDTPQGSIRSNYLYLLNECSSHDQINRVFHPRLTGVFDSKPRLLRLHPCCPSHFPQPGFLSKRHIQEKREKPHIQEKKYELLVLGIIISLFTLGIRSNQSSLEPRFTPRKNLCLYLPRTKSLCALHTQ